MRCLFSLPQQVRGCNLAKFLINHDALSDFLVIFRAVDKEVL
jgi:hypothetical protein